MKHFFLLFTLCVSVVSTAFSQDYTKYFSAQRSLQTQEEKELKVVKEDEFKYLLEAFRVAKAQNKEKVSEGLLLAFEVYLTFESGDTTISPQVREFFNMIEEKTYQDNQYTKYSDLIMPIIANLKTFDQQRALIRDKYSKKDEILRIKHRLH